MAKVIVTWPTVNMERSDLLALEWKEQGYDVAVLIEQEHSFNNIDHIVAVSQWQGFPYAANKLCHTFKDQYDVIILAGDDIHPDMGHKADMLVEQYLDHFRGSYGVMQPTGDKYGCYDIACISPWIGADYIRNRPGPYHTGYYHYYSDAELQDVAMLNNCFQQRDDLSQYHDHWSRNKQQRPQYLMKALNHHSSDKKLYEERKKHNFPGA